jgi:cytochrome P450 family 628
MTIRCVDAVAKIYKGRYRRGTWYDASRINGERSLAARREYDLFPVWRKTW